jgi:predicted regulator of Ras-like GTPase activity (Roadblock/LC7/MglB family)/DNA-binding NarL/FixJ family response regulator
MLKEGLETTASYKVVLAHTGSDALEAIVENPFDMVIVDMGLADVKPARLVKAIREAKPSMRLMLIPLFGGQLPDELQEVPIQGILPKPFFVGDLPRLVASAMGIAAPATPQPAAAPGSMEDQADPPDSSVAEDVSPSAPVAPQSVPPEETPAQPAPVPESLARWRTKEEDIVQLLKALNREVRAECILVTAGAQLVAFSGLLGREQTAKLAQLVAESAAAASRAAAFLGEPAGHFEQTLHEGAEYCLYSLNLSEDLVLSLALSTDVPLGTLRYRARQTAEELLQLMF